MFQCNVDKQNSVICKYKPYDVLRESYFTEDLKLVRTSEEDPYKSYTKVYTILIKINPPCKS